MLRELEGGGEQATRRADGFDVVDETLGQFAFVFVQGWFRIEQIDLAGAARHEELDDGFCPPVEVRGLGTQVGGSRRICGGVCLTQQIGVKQGGETRTQQAITHPSEKVAAPLCRVISWTGLAGLVLWGHGACSFCLTWLPPFLPGHLRCSHPQGGSIHVNQFWRIEQNVTVVLQCALPGQLGVLVCVLVAFELFFPVAC